ncbi:TetR family transcriptional regulator [Tsukamurella sp. 1534]|uniref:TetR family transcriptional regulator n=1 Tax=Tsukamurella sp. 1534 TaxID=1151061 RepID=UPI00030A09EA|nr:TetR family transcriptional regulator [Tsukamurella sp. 1534]
MSFQRARSPEQRAERREAILATADTMLAEMPVADLTLNELSRRVGLAKSNVLRYFESREEILLELLARSSRGWVGELGRAVDAAVDPATSFADRTDAYAAAFARTAAAHPHLLGLIAVQAGVLERNVSGEAVLRFKRAARDLLDELAEALAAAIPELGPAAPAACALGVTLAGALFVQAEQSAACAAAYAADPTLAPLHVDLVPALTAAVATVIAGAAARSAPGAGA